MSSAPAVPRAFSPSGAQRVAACPPSAVLPQTPVPSGAAADRGTAFHTYAADLFLAGREIALPRVPAGAPWRSMCAGFDPYTLPLPWSTAGAKLVEVAYAYDVAADSTRVLGYQLGRGYPPHTATELCGSADLVLLCGDGAGTRWLHLVDWKTGRRGVPAADHWQLRIYALAAARHHGAERVHVHLVYVGEDGQADPRPEDSATFDALALDGIAADLRALLAEVAAVDPTAPVVSPGEHCRYCPARPACPAFARELAAVNAAGPGWLDRVRAELDTPEGFALWHRDRLPVLRAAVDVVADELRARVAAAGEIALPDGAVVRAAESSRTTLHADTLLDLLGEHVGGREAAQALARARGAYRTNTFPVLKTLTPKPTKERKTA